MLSKSGWYMSFVSIPAAGTFFRSTGTGVRVIQFVSFHPWDKYPFNLMRFDSKYGKSFLKKNKKCHLTQFIINAQKVRV